MANSTVLWQGVQTDRSAQRADVILNRHRLVDRIATLVMWGAALFLVAVLFAVVATLLYNGLPALSWRFLTSASSLTEADAGIGPQLWVSFYILTHVTQLLSEQDKTDYS